MSTVSSLYGSPRASMISRDPDGRDASVVDDSVSVGLEPAGSRADETFDGPVSMSYSMGSSTIPKLNQMDFSRLVGAPPPPPKSPPPRKGRRRGGSGTPRSSDGRSFASSKVDDTQTYSSFDDDSLMMYSTGSTTVPSILQPPQVEENETTHHIRNITPAPSEDSLKVDSPPREAGIDRSSLLVEQRMKAAQATYESDELVLENTEVATDNILRPAMATIENKQEVVEEQQVQLATPTQVPTKLSQPSPRSAALATEAVVEETPKEIQDEQNDEPNVTSNMTVFTHISETSSEMPSENKVFSVAPPTVVPKSVVADSNKKGNTKKDEKPKRGFFKKLFRGRGKKTTTKEEEVPSQAPVPSEPSEIDAPADEVNPRPDSEETPVALKSALKSSEERQHQGPVIDTEEEQKPSQPFDESSTADVETKPVEHVESEVAAVTSPSDASLKGGKSFAQDPPDDGHGDPPVSAGRPLISPTSIRPTETTASEEDEEFARIETVRSRINDVYEEHAHVGREVEADNLRHDDEISALPEIDPKMVTRDEAGYFFAQDDVSALSTGVESKSFEKVTVQIDDSEPRGLSPLNNVSTRAQDAGEIAEPGAKHVDPFSAPFFGGQTVQGPLPTPANHHGLRVRVDGQISDPAGASPMKWDVSGKPAPLGEFRDPVGESPVHAWEKDEVEDVPISSATEEEKKDDNEADAETKSEIPFDEKSLSVDVAKASAVVIKQIHSIPTPQGSESGPRTGLKPVPPRPKAKQAMKIETDVEKAGFKSTSSTPVAGGDKILSVAAAALTNAKAVAYLHRLEGEPSPRHTWHSSKRKSSAPSPLSVRAKRAVGKRYQHKKQTQPAAKKPSPDEYGAHNFDQSQFSEPEKPAQELHPLKSKEGAMFSAYNSKFQGRKPSKKSLPTTPTGRRASVGSDIGETLMKSRPTTPANKHVIQVDWSKIEMIPGKISGIAVMKGIMLRRSKRDDDVANGRSERVVLTPKPKTEGRNRFNFFPADESEIKDPIQRAGRRLLSKSAIPIQCAARRYIARREAIDRMWALIVIQSHFRRWRAETNLQANIHSATLIQKTYRGWVARDKLKEMNYCAAQVQKIVRGYLVQARVYDTMYYIVRLQAFLRGCNQRRKHANWVKLSNEKAIPIQAAYRAYKARQEFEVSIASAIVIQSIWRSYSARTSYQFEIVDIIIVQSISRRWAACRQVENLKNAELFAPASIIQAGWRGHQSRKLYKEHQAALKIQTVWRRFQCYTDYIFALVDVLVVQRTARRWLAIRAAQRKKHERAAIKIQAIWRKCQAQSDLILSMVQIIVAQSVARRYLSRFAVQRRIKEAEVENAEQKRLDAAATAIQKTWRGFWGFSHFIIVQYEITRLQAMVRGRIARQTFNLKLGCAIIIQATIRRHLAKRAIEKRVLADTMTYASTLELRERNAAKKIQFWWRIVLDWTKEKKAALTIERFFIHVRAEVDREIMRRERKKMMKREQKRLKRRESEERMLEKVWLNTVDENTSLHQSRDTRSASETRSKSTPRQRDMPSPRQHRSQSPYRAPALTLPNHAHMSDGASLPANIGQEVDIDGYPIQRLDSTLSRASRVPTDAVRMTPSEDHSEVSNITNPSVFHRMNTGRLELPIRHSREKRMSTEDYIKKYSQNASGNQTAPNRMTKGQPQHFFSDDNSVGSRKSRSSTPANRRASSGTPRSAQQGPLSTTPRGNYIQSKATTPRTPRSQIHQVPSPRIAVGFPPVTPKSTMKGGRQQISRRETAETESQTTMHSYSKASPRSRQEGHIVNHGSPVVVMKHYPGFAQSDSIDAQEVMYLGRDEFGEEYGEV